MDLHSADESQLRRTKQLSTVAILLNRFMSCLVCHNVFHVVSAFQSIVSLHFFVFLAD